MAEHRNMPPEEEKFEIEIPAILVFVKRREAQIILPYESEDVREHSDQEDVEDQAQLVRAALDNRQP